MNEMTVDFTLLCYELYNREENDKVGYKCRGYPQADMLVPALKKVGAKFQIIEIWYYKDRQNYFELIQDKIKSDKVIVEWDGSYRFQDWRTLLAMKKELYIIPHNELHSEDAKRPDKEKIMREEIVKHSKKVIFGSEWGANLWNEFGNDKYAILYPPTRIGKEFDKETSKLAIGVNAKYSLICWGLYSGKDYEAIFPWVKKWGDTCILFCGSGSREILIEETEKKGIGDRVFFSPSGISEVDSDLWFSATDLHIYPRINEGSSTLLSAVGHGKCTVARPLDYYLDIARFTGTVIASDLEKVSRELLLDEKRRKIYEERSRTYAKENSYEKYAIKLGKLMGYKYKERE